MYMYRHVYIVTHLSPWSPCRMTTSSRCRCSQAQPATRLVSTSASDHTCELIRSERIMRSFMTLFIVTMHYSKQFCRMCSFTLRIRNDAHSLSSACCSSELFLRSHGNTVSISCRLRRCDGFVMMAMTRSNVFCVIVADVVTVRLEDVVSEMS